MPSTTGLNARVTTITQVAQDVIALELRAADGYALRPLATGAHVDIELPALGRPWSLYYCARTPERAAFVQDLAALPGRVIPVYDGVPGGTPIDLPSILSQVPAEAPLYCCGPASLMEAFDRATAGRPAQQVHVEWFKPRHSAAARVPEGNGAFELKLARSGMNLPVPVGKSILDVLIEAGVAVHHSCCDGVCGTCETRVLEGVPDHRDSVLFGEDARSTDRMMVCVSRSRTPSLTLDL